MRYFIHMIGAVALLTLAACGDGGDMPEFDEGATYNGRPLSEYTKGLSDLNPQQRLLALRNVAQFGVNGLPAREQIQKMVNEDADFTIRIIALGTLHVMQDPALPGIYADILANPDYTDSARFWREMAQGVDLVFTDEELGEQMGSIYSDSPEHALMLFNASSGTKLELPLANILIRQDVTPGVLQRLVGLVPQLDMSEQEKIGFIVKNRLKFPNQTVPMNGLMAIGTDKALDAAMEIIQSDNLMPIQQKVQWISTFGVKADAQKTITRLAKLASDGNRTEPEYQQIFGAMARKINTLRQGSAVRQGNVDDPAYAKFSAALDTYVTVLAGFTESPAPQARALAALNLVSLAGQTAKTAEALDGQLAPVFGLLKSEQEEIVLGTIMQQLSAIPYNYKIPEGSSVGAKLAAAVYARDNDDKWAYAVGDGLLKAIDKWVAPSRLDRVAMIRLVTDEAKANAGHPANARVFDWILAMTRNQMIAKTITNDVTEIAGRAGTLALDSGITQAHMEKIYGGTNPGNLTIATQAPSTDAIIAFMDPIVMSQDPKFIGTRFAERFFDLILNTNIYYLRGGNPDQPKYVAWVRKVAKNGHSALRPIAAQGLERNGF